MAAGQKLSCGGWRPRVNSKSKLEAHLLRHLAQIIVTFLETESAGHLILAGRQLLPQKNITRCFESALIYRQRLAKHIEPHRCWPGKIKFLPSQQRTVEGQGGGRVFFG